jgi:apolipoprotein N-acyltransferase
MWKLLACFFSEAWCHRQNRFIAVGGIAVFFVFVMLALAPVPWVPESVKQTVAVLCGLSILATILLMLYYALNFALVVAIWLFRRVFGASRQESGSSAQGAPAR